jgi:hypothetical protein
MRIQFGKQKDIAAFRLEPLTPIVPLSGFTCPIEEYNEYLHNDAFRSQNDHIARTAQECLAPLRYLNLVMFLKTKRFSAMPASSFFVVLVYILRINRETIEKLPSFYRLIIQEFLDPGEVMPPERHPVTDNHYRHPDGLVVGNSRKFLGCRINGKDTEIGSQLARSLDRFIGAYRGAPTDTGDNLHIGVGLQEGLGFGHAFNGIDGTALGHDFRVWGKFLKGIHNTVPLPRSSSTC